MRSQTNQSSQWSPSFLTAVVENVFDGVIACDANGILTNFNRAQTALAGEPAPPVGPDQWAKHFGVVRADGTDPSKEELPLYRALCGEIIKNFEYEVYRKDGGYRVVICNGQAIYDDGGVKLGAVITMQDITALKTAEKLQKAFLETTQGQLADSEKRFRTLFEQSPLSVQLLSVDGRTTRVNSAWKKLWGIPEDFIQNFIFKEYNMLEDKVLENRGVLQYIRQGFAGTPTKIPAIFYDPVELGKTEGRGRWVEALLTPIKDEKGEVVEVVLIHTDVTDKIESERELQAAKQAAEEASRLKSSFLANMSHEIRTPLSSILGYSQLLKSRDLNSDEARSFLSTIERNSIALTKIIDDILDISKVEAGRLEIAKVSVNLKSMFDEVNALLRVQLRNDVKLHVAPVPKEITQIAADPLRLRQILINLVGNALKFTEHGTIVLAAKLKGSMIEITVSDTGIGIPAELQSILFQPFSQADNSYTRKFSGTGLGLALSRRLAHAMGGDVTLENSVEGEGSTFSVVLPFETATASEIMPPSVSGLVETQSLQGLQVLLVDDSEDNRFLFKRILSKQGAIVSEAVNGEDAIEKALASSYRVVLMDVQMPVMDGLQATSELRKRGYTTPIIALTAHALSEERDRCLRAGADAHVVKPVNFHDLTSTILNLTRKQQASS